MEEGQLDKHRVLSGLLSVVALSACAAETDPHPPWVDGDCTGTGCGQGGQIGAVAAPDAGLADTRDVDEGADASVGADGSTAAIVPVEIREALDLTTTLPEPVLLSGNVYRLAQLTDATWDQELVLEAGALAQLPVPNEGAWFLFSQDSASVWLSSVVWVPPLTDILTVALFSSQFVADLAASLGNSAVALDAAAGHAIVRVMDSSGNALASVSTTVAQGVIAYGVGGTATDFQTETGETGTIVWLNANTGGAVSLDLSYQTRTHTIELPVIPSSVTMAQVELNLQMP
jgi:hypothetical protein